MAKGDLQRLIERGDGLTMEQRVVRRVADAPEVPLPREGVTRLNEGVFELERMRAGPVVKARTK